MTFGLGLRPWRNTLLMPSFSSGCCAVARFAAVPHVGSVVGTPSTPVKKESVPEPPCGRVGAIGGFPLPGLALGPSSAPQVLALSPLAAGTAQPKISFSWFRVRLFGALVLLVVA